MNLTTIQLKQIIEEELQSCQQEYGLCVKGVTDPNSNEAIECIDEMRDCEEEQSHVGTLAKMKAKAQAGRPAELSAEDPKGGFEAYHSKWWSFPKNKKALQQIQNNHRFNGHGSWHLNYKTKIYRFGAGKKPDYRTYPGYKEVMASVWPKYEKCHEAAKESYRQWGGELSYDQASQYYEMEKGGCEDRKLQPIENWLDGLEKRALEKYEQENMDPEIYKYFEKHTARKDKIAALQTQRSQLKKDIKGWEDAQASIEYMQESKKNIKVKIK